MQTNNKKFELWFYLQVGKISATKQMTWECYMTRNWFTIDSTWQQPRKETEFCFSLCAFGRIVDQHVPQISHSPVMGHNPFTYLHCISKWSGKIFCNSNFKQVSKSTQEKKVPDPNFAILLFQMCNVKCKVLEPEKVEHRNKRKDLMDHGECTTGRKTHSFSRF